MKIVNIGGEKGTEGKLGALNRTLSSLAPSASRSVLQSQEAVIQIFKNILNNRFHLVQGLRFPGIDGPGPLLLIGPAGIWLMEASPVSGVFRAMQERWDEMDPKARVFRPARTNLIARTLAAGTAAQSLFDEMGETLPAVETVILFTHPGAHLEMQQPAVRLIQADAIARFAAGLLQIRPVLEPETVQMIVDRLNLPEQEAVVIPELEPLPAEPKPPDPMQIPHLPAIPEDEPEVIRRIANKAAFSRYQWSVLGLLLFLNLLVLIAAIVIILIIT